MSVSSTTAALTFVGNNSTSTAYALTGLRFDASSWLDVATIDDDGTVTALVLGTHYTLGGDGSAGTGTLTSTSGNAIPASKVLRVRRNTPHTQPLDLVNGTAPDQPSLEAALDRLTLANQDQARADSDNLARAVRVADGQLLDPLPGRVDRAARYLAFDEAGNPVAASLTGDTAADRAEAAVSLIHISAAITLADDFTLSSIHYGKLISTSKGSACAITMPVLDASVYARFALDTTTRGFTFTGATVFIPGGTLAAAPTGSGIWLVELIGGKWFATGSSFSIASAVGDSSAGTVEELAGEFNALLASLRSAGLLEP